MIIQETELSGVLVLTPKVLTDDRGEFFETYREERFKEHGLEVTWKQDNVSTSKRGVLRGLHYQFPFPQKKLVWVVEGEVQDVAVDIRVGSPTFGKWHSEILSAENHKQLLIPEGFAHGFLVLSEKARFCYKCSESYQQASDRVIRWDEPEFQIEWMNRSPILSEKDQFAPVLNGPAPITLPTGYFNV